MESIAELKRICHPEHKNKEARGNINLFLMRKVSIYLTWIFLHVPVTPNQISVLSLFMVILAGILLGTGRIAVALVGVFLIHFSQVLDCVDGEIARYKQQHSINGMFLSWIASNITNAAKWFGLGFYCYFNSGNVFYVLLAGLIVRFRLSAPLLERNVLMVVANLNEFSGYNKELSKKDENHSRSAGSQSLSKGLTNWLYESLWLRDQFRALVFGGAGHTIIITISVVLDLLLGNNTCTISVLVAFGILIPGQSLLGIWRRVTNNLIEQTYWFLIEKFSSSKREHNLEERKRRIRCGLRHFDG